MSHYVMYGMVLPCDLKAAIDRYVEHGLPTGGFLEAVIKNDLREAVARADNNNIRIIPVIVAYLYNRCPHGCWGREGAVREWRERKRMDRLAEGDVR